MIYLKAFFITVCALVAFALAIVGNVYLTVLLKQPDAFGILLIALEMISFGIYMMALDGLRKREKKRSQEVAR